MTIFGQQTKKGSSGGSGELTPTAISHATFFATLNNQSIDEGFYLIVDATASGYAPPVVGMKADGGVLVQVYADKLGVLQCRNEAQGSFLNPDFKDYGDYSGVLAYTGIAKLGNFLVWQSANEVIQFTYNNLDGGSFQVGDTVTALSGASGSVVYNNEGFVSTMQVLMTTPGNPFVSTDDFDNGAGISATVVTVNSEFPAFNNGAITFWDGLHYQVIDKTQFDGTNPSVNASAYKRLPKTLPGMGYISDSDFVLYDYVGDQINFRWDKRNNKINYAGLFQWGNDSCISNSTLGQATINNINNTGSFTNNILAGTGELSCNNRFQIDVSENNFIIYGDLNLNHIQGGLSKSTMTTNEAITLTDLGNYSNQSIRNGYSDFAADFDLTGLTTLDFTSDLNYIGIANIIAGSVSIDLFANFPVNQPVRITPVSGVTLVFVHGTGANQPRCNGGGNLTINGTNGDFVDFQKRPDGFIYAITVGQFG